MPNIINYPIARQKNDSRTAASEGIFFPWVEKIYTYQKLVKEAGLHLLTLKLPLQRPPTMPYHESISPVNMFFLFT
jgi:hypothetical protein